MMAVIISPLDPVKQSGYAHLFLYRAEAHTDYIELRGSEREEVARVRFSHFVVFFLHSVDPLRLFASR